MSYYEVNDSLIQIMILVVKHLLLAPSFTAFEAF